MQTTRVAAKLRAQIHQFLGIFSPHFSRPKLKFLEQMLYGVSASQDCKLSQVARVLGDHRAAGGLDADGDRAVGEPLPHFGHPLVKDFGGLLQTEVLGLAAVGWADPQVVLLVGPIQADRRGECRCRIHDMICAFWLLWLGTQALPWKGL